MQNYFVTFAYWHFLFAQCAISAEIFYELENVKLQQTILANDWSIFLRICKRTRLIGQNQAPVHASFARTDRNCLARPLA